MSKKTLKLIFFKSLILAALLFSFTNLMAAEGSMHEKIAALKKKVEDSRVDSSDKQDLCTVLIMLPTKYNPDEKGERRPIPLGDVQKTSIEILEKFDQCSTIDPFPKVGLWKRSGIIDDIVEDVNVTLELDNVSQKKKNALVKYCREVLLDRFQQEAIHMRFIPKKMLYDVSIVTRKP